MFVTNEDDKTEPSSKLFFFQLKQLNLFIQEFQFPLGMDLNKKSNCFLKERIFMVSDT